MRSTALLALVGLGASGCGGARSHRLRTTAAVETPPAAEIPAGAQSAHRRPRPVSGTGALRAALKRSFKRAGPRSGAAVYDLTSHTWLFRLRPGVARPPASVEKLYTSVAVLRKLGPGTTLQTRVLGAGHLGRGVWHGNLYLVGGGDPTFGEEGFNRTWEQGYGPTALELVRQLKARGIRRVSGEVIGDGRLFDHRPGPPSTGFAPDIPDIGGQLGALTYDHGATRLHGSPVAFAAREFALTMRGAGIRVHARPQTGTAPPTARTLATVSSPRMSVLLRLMNVPSDDFFAEMLTKQLGVRFGGAGSTSAGARVIRKVMSADYGLRPQIVDGSGLSRADLSSPVKVVQLLRELWGTATGARVYSSLPVVGVNGTVQTIAVHTPAKGACVAKTGTLTDVTNLAGYCHSRHGRRVAFALFIDGPPNWRAIELEGAMIGAIARF